MEFILYVILYDNKFYYIHYFIRTYNEDDSILVFKKIDLIILEGIDEVFDSIVVDFDLFVVHYLMDYLDFRVFIDIHFISDGNDFHDFHHDYAFYYDMVMVNYFDNIDSYNDFIVLHFKVFVIKISTKEHYINNLVMGN